MKKETLPYWIFLIVILLCYSCSSTISKDFRKTYSNANAMLHEQQNLKTKSFVKAHLKNGSVAIMTKDWKVDTIAETIGGKMEIYDFQRYKKYSGDTTLPLNLVAVFETNDPLKLDHNSKTVALTVLIIANVVLGVFCITTPKACFGSCPTFYTDENSNFHYAQAEGFSNAISPALEYGDVDALDNSKVLQKEFSLHLKNEALETHCINEVKLLACPRVSGGRVYHDADEKFYSCQDEYLPSSANTSGKDVLDLLLLKDKQEYFSLSDENNLNTKEELILNFDKVPHNERLGLILNFRQTMMTTYLFYNLIGYMGDEATDYLTEIEKNSALKNKFKHGIFKCLGGVEISSWDEKKGKWQMEGTLDEIGPIAINQQIQLLQSKATNGKLKLKLRYTKGLWRFDYAALTKVQQEIKPIELSPNEVYKNGEIDPLAKVALVKDAKHLVTLPGDRFKLNFQLPESHSDYELFIYSKGYYLEYMRDNWLKDKNIKKVRQAILNPKSFLKSESKTYKQYETQIEKDFWNSRINTKIFAAHENN